MKTSPPHGTADFHPLNSVSWRKSSRSQGAGAECVELAQTAGVVAARDSKDPGGPWLVVSTAAARVLIDAIKQGRHDL